MQLRVPLVRQPKHSKDCGVAAVAMLLEYYGVRYDYARLRREIGLYPSWGTATPQLGLWLVEHGFAVEIVTMHPSLFNLKSRFADRAALLRHFAKVKKGLTERLDRIALDYFEQFVKAGGTVTPRIPGIADIRAEIKAKRPPIVLLTHWFLHDSGLPPRFTFHYNVVTGVDEKKVFVNDPDWGAPFGGPHSHPIDQYLYAIHASAYGTIDNACIMKVRKL